MAVRKTLNNLKERPREDKAALASGIAIAVVVVLLAGWAVAFFRGISVSGGSERPQPGVEQQSGPEAQQ